MNQYVTPGMPHWLVLSAILFSIGLYGLLTRRNAVGVLMAVELMLNSAALNFVVFNRYVAKASLDGHIMAIYEDLIEIGLDAVNSQLFCMDIEEIGRRFKGRLTFWGEIDRQHLLPFGTVPEIRSAVRRVADALYDPAGHIIAQFEFGAGAKLANAHAVHETWAQISR